LRHPLILRLKAPPEQLIRFSIQDQPQRLLLGRSNRSGRVLSRSESLGSNTHPSVLGKTPLEIPRVGESLTVLMARWRRSWADYSLPGPRWRFGWARLCRLAREVVVILNVVERAQQLYRHLSKEVLGICPDNTTDNTRTRASGSPERRESPRDAGDSEVHARASSCPRCGTVPPPPPPQSPPTPPPWRPGHPYPPSSCRSS